MTSVPPVVAILNSNDDTVEMLRMMLESEGMIAVSAHVSALRRGHFDFGGFLAEHDPRVIIYDVIPPYETSWRFFEHLRAMPSMANRKFVLTSTNPERVLQATPAEPPVYEIIGKPYDMQVIVNAVKKAAGA
jgi:DNA-binding NarL/FixJ family response regulator